MPHDGRDRPAIDRRSFVKASLIPAVLPLASSLTDLSAQGAQPTPAGPEIIDSNVHLFDWPFRRLKYARTEALTAKLRKHRGDNEPGESTPMDVAILADRFPDVPII